MSKKCYRFFGGLLNAQAKWLNKMSEKGYRLVRTGRVLYEFEECSPDEVTYCVEFIGEKSKENATDYADFLEDMGYKVFFKNINLNYSVGKVRLRPWAEMGGRIATNATTFNRELLIVEKSNDGKPFELHTSYADKEKYYRNLRNPWLFLLLKPDVLQKMWVLRKLCYPMDDLEAMEFLLDKVKSTKGNAEFFDAMRRG
jgi:hypothetical protein